MKTVKRFMDTIKKTDIGFMGILGGGREKGPEKLLKEMVEKGVILGRNKG